MLVVGGGLRYEDDGWASTATVTRAESTALATGRAAVDVLAPHTSIAGHTGNGTCSTTALEPASR